MALTETGDFPQARHMLLSSRPLTDGERAAIAAELATDPAGRGYKGQDGAFKAAAELFGLLNDGYTVANAPTEEVPLRIDRPDCSIDEFLTFTAGPRLAAAQSSNPAIAAKWAGTTAILLPFVTPLSRVPLSAATTKGIMKQIVDDGLLTADVVAAFLTMPNPAYSPVVSMRPRGVEVAGVVVELGEVVSIVAGLS